MRAALMTIGCGTLLAAAGPALAQPACPPTAAGPAGTQSLPVARRIGDDDRATLMLGQPTTLLLAPAGKVLFAAPPARPITATEQGGLVRFRANVGGTYRVALGSRAWIEVVARNVALESIAHSHGAPCSWIAKQVDFALAAGDYVLQISGTDDPSVVTTVSQLP